MDQKELNTFKNFISSNNSFLSAIESFSPYTPDIYVKVELLIIYLHVNYHNFLEIITSNALLALLNGNYHIEDNRIVIENKKYTIEELANLATSLKYERQKRVAIYFSEYASPSTSPLKDQPKPPRCQVINLTEVLQYQELTLKERGYLFERTCMVNTDTIPFINEMNNRFVALINHLITNILKGTIDIDEDIYNKVLGGFLKLFPFAGYAKERVRVPYEDIDLPLNEIGLTKVKYSDECLDFMKSQASEYSSRLQKLMYETDIMVSSGFITNKSVIDIRNRKAIYLNSKIAEILFNYNEYSHNPSVLNALFFKYIYQAFCSGNVIINQFFRDPVIKFFTIEKGEVTSFIAIHLTTLLRIIDPSILTRSSTKKMEYTT